MGSRIDRDQALARIFGQQLLFPPGQDTAYSNSGYTRLAAIIEEASGQPFWGYLRSILDEADLRWTLRHARASPLALDRAKIPRPRAPLLLTGPLRTHPRAQIPALNPLSAAHISPVCLRGGL